MPRKLRLFANDAIYHVYCRTARGEFVFDEPGELDRWIDTVAFVADQEAVVILAWCLMSNHFHLVLRTERDPLCRPMARIQGRVAKDHNRRKGWTGRLWQSRYKARMVDDPDYLDHLFAYVHLNPVAAGLTTDPADYPASGHRALLGLEHPRLVDVRAGLACFHENPKTARDIYQNHLRCVAESRWIRDEVRQLPWWKTVKDDDETVSPSLAPKNAETFDGAQLASPPALPTFEQIVEIFEFELDLAPSQLRGRGRSMYECWCRSLLTVLVVNWLGFKAKDLAVFLNKSSVSVSRWRCEGMQLQKSDPGFRYRLRRLQSKVKHLNCLTDINSE